MKLLSNSLKNHQWTRGFQPRLEILESRWLPAVHLTQLDLDYDGNMNDIQIVGDAAANRIVITDDPTAGKMHIAIDANNDGDFSEVALGEIDKDFAAVHALRLN